MHADAEFLASAPQRMPESVAEIFKPFYSDARVRQHVDPQMAGLHRALDFLDDNFDWAHVRNRGERNEAIAHAAVFRYRVVVGSDAIELELRIVVEKSSARAVGKQHLGVDAIAIQSDQPLRRLVNFPRPFFPALGIIAALFHRRWAIAYVAALNLAIDHPALDRMRKFLFLDLDDVGNSIAPFLRRHARRIGVRAKLPVRIRTDQTKLCFHICLGYEPNP